MNGIEVHIDDPVCVIRLDRPERLNALTFPMMADLRRAVDDAAADPRVVGIVITGNGRGFCSGLDAAVLAAVTSGDGDDVGAGPDADVRTVPEGELPGIFSYLLQVPKPVIAAINGVAAGGGVVLASMCDVRIASTEAAFATVFLQRGLVAEHGTSWILPRLLGPGRADRKSTRLNSSH